MIKLNYRNVDKDVIGKEHGLEVEKEFSKHSTFKSNFVQSLLNSIK